MAICEGVSSNEDSRKLDPLERGLERSEAPVLVRQPSFFASAKAFGRRVDATDQLSARDGRNNPRGPVPAPRSHTYLDDADHSSIFSPVKEARTPRVTP